MNKNQMKQEIRKALQAAEQMISKTSSTSVRNFHSSSQGWDITEFAGDIFLTYIRNGLDKTTNLDVAKGLEILLAAKIPASVPLNAITPRIVVEVSK